MHIPDLPHSAPSRGNLFSQTLGRLILRLAGWQYQGEWPNISKCVVIVAPHTSNWDFIIALSAALAGRVNFRWLGKASLFRTPLAGFFRWQGGIPAVRDHAQGLVGSIVEEFESAPKMWLALSPEGTRRKVDQWRSGFYHMAQNAQVPVVPVALDWRNKRITILETFHVSGQIEQDMKHLQQMFEPYKGLIN